MKTYQIVSCYIYTHYSHHYYKAIKNQDKGFKTSELRKIIQELEDLDYKYKIGLIDLNVGLESILCTYCS